MSSAFAINIKFKNKIKKFLWRQTFTPQEFQSLIANVNGIKSSDKIVGLLDKNGNKKSTIITKNPA